jgi:UDP-N-acetylmuramoyl-tripeptide--D-alanyl-D-alanine ligase
VIARPGSGLTLARAVQLAGGEIHPERARGAAEQLVLSGASIDTRTLRPGELFAPLAGGHVDGHQFLEAAFRNGAAAALCARASHPAWRGREPGPLVVVDDVTAALQAIAAGHRAAWDGLVLGITGSSGKTTTKDLVSAVLAADRPTIATQGNLNNHWGVPLTLLRLASEIRAAVVEMGTNHPGEIAALAALARPGMALITNAGTAHLEHFGSVEAIAREKSSLARALPAGGVAFAGADSPLLIEALAGLRARLVTYGLAPGADVRPDRLEDRGAEGTRLEVAGFPPLALRLVGRHQAMNALGALAVARELRLDPARTVSALSAHRAGGKRMEVKHAGGATLLVDCYNANPESTRAALQTLATWPDSVRRIAVLGDMLELGPEAPALHRAAGASIRDAELWVVGAHADDTAAGARAAGIETRVFADKPALARELESSLAPGTVVLVKASRGAALEDVLSQLDVEED